MKLYLENVNSGRRYLVVGRDPDKGSITMQDPEGRQFTEAFDKDKFKAWGYTLVKVDDEVAEDDDA